MANERQGGRNGRRGLTCSRHVDIPGNLIMPFHYEHRAARHSTSAIWMTPRSRGTLYQRICMFNAISVACAPRPRLRSFSHRRDIKYSAVSSTSACCLRNTLLPSTTKPSSSVNLTNVNFPGDNGLGMHCQKQRISVLLLI